LSTMYDVCYKIFSEIIKPVTTFGLKRFGFSIFFCLTLLFSIVLSKL
jgi:hypothetical protein